MNTYNSCEAYVLDRVVKLEKENEEIQAALAAEINENLALRARLSLIADHVNTHSCSHGTYIDFTLWDSATDYQDIVDALDLSSDEENEDE